MGFPEIMYLSKSQVRRLWPDLALEKGGFKLEEVAVKAALSINPAAEVGGKWTAKGVRIRQAWDGRPGALARSRKR